MHRMKNRCWSESPQSVDPANRSIFQVDKYILYISVLCIDMRSMYIESCFFFFFVVVDKLFSLFSSFFFCF